MRPCRYTDDFKPEPYWWDQLAPLELAASGPPGSVDVLIIGSGYSGLNAAIETARGGRHTVVVEADRVGWGCSTRNGGQISTSLKPGLAALARRYGRPRAIALVQEGVQSLRWIKQFVAQQRLDCDFAEVGRFHAAHNSAAFEKLVRQAEQSRAECDSGAYVVARSEQARELGTDAYYGGVVYPQHACLHPGHYHRGLLRLAIEAGARIVPHCPVVALQPGSSGYLAVTPKGSIRANKVVLATNGYTGAIAPWQRKRVVPIGSYVIATEPIDAELMERIMPTGRIISDSRKVVYYYRPSPDRRRIIFGGRVSHREISPLVSAGHLHRELVRLFPQLAQVRVSHSWMGLVAYTFDTLMHIGHRRGLHYALGYCGSGVGMASYLGMRMGQQVLGLPQGGTAFDGLPFPTRPFYTGQPWFLPPAMLYYRCRDRLNF